MGHLRGGRDDLADLAAGGEGDTDGAEGVGAEGAAVDGGNWKVGGAAAGEGGECIISTGAEDVG